MHDEDGFLAAILQTPADDVTRLVFADWLDEQGDPTCKAKADFIRLELRMPESPERSLNRVRLLNQLQKLAAQLDPAWLAVVSHPELEACRVAFRFECPKQWEKLAPTASPKVRHCESCQQYVHYCTSLTEARYHAANGHCVAVSLALARRPDDLTTSPPRLAPDRVGHHSVAGRLEAPRLTLGFAIPDVPRPTLARQWDPEPKQPREPQQPKSRRRKKRRTSHRNLQRENWEEVE